MQVWGGRCDCQQGTCEEQTSCDWNNGVFWFERKWEQQQARPDRDVSRGSIDVYWGVPDVRVEILEGGLLWCK